MYIPKHFQINDQREAIDFIRKYSFGTLVTVENALPVATHIPFTIREQGDQLVITSHIALANPQSNTLTGGQALVIFTEPHAYISPQHYEKEQAVPTWNYIAVHAYGDATIITDEVAKLKMLEEMISNYDTAYLQQWAGLSIEYKSKMVKGITAFEIAVSNLQGKKKLSQNRTETEKGHIINSLSNSSNQAERDIAGYMSNL